MESGLEVRDQDEELLELPTNWLQCWLYGKWVTTLGLKAKLVDDEGLIWLEEIENWDGSDRQGLKPCVFKTFRSFWKKEYPKLVLPKPREDICTDCFILSHTFRYFSSDVGDGKKGGTNGYEKRENAVAKAQLHVTRAIAQRQGFNALVDIAK